jgi:hypothetical protein
MRPLVYMFYHGDVHIAYWEWMAALLYLVVIFFVFIKRRNRRLHASPEYRYYLSGIYAKLFGATFFSLIYFYYYEGGDTTAYFYSALAMRNLAFVEPVEYFKQLMGDNSMRAWTVYSEATAKPYQYVFFDNRTFAVLQITSVLAIFTNKSFLLTTLLTATITFYGVWKCYRTFVSYFPDLSGKLAIGFLFMPSAIFWGSGIMKDTWAFSAVCLWVHGVDEIFFKKRNTVSRSFMLIIAALVMLWFKPYMFTVIFPCSLIGSMDKFALDSALETIRMTQKDLSNERAYGAHRFELGEFDGTWLGLMGQFPVAVNAALFRPYIWEAKTPVMLLSGLENLWVLVLAIIALLRAGPFFAVRTIAGVPIVLMAVLFSILFAFTVGVTTPNFGALVRFKIPLVPFFISSLYIIVRLAKARREDRNAGIEFDLKRYRMGTSQRWIGAVKRDRPGRRRT